jgi:Fic-DOC domain mobile mystery protein B
MNADPFRIEPGNTELSEEERLDLIPSIGNRSQLNEVERLNINQARVWAMRPRLLKRDDLPTDHFARELHKRMFSHVWKWAGKYRTTGKNIGWAPHLIAEGVRNAFSDVAYWLQHDTYKLPEAAVRLHHRLVVVHPWPNGNGRHARLMADILIASRGGDDLTWGSGSDLMAPGEVRNRYLTALKKADAGDFDLLMDFSRS